jgi:hypothetical protein
MSDSVATIVAPERKKGRPTAEQAELRKQFSAAVCKCILELESTLDFRPSARGWCYVLEGDGYILKGDFDTAEKLINDARKCGDLPMGICGDDPKRATDNLERKPDDADVKAEAKSWIAYVKNEAHKNYRPFSFWDDLDCYVELWVEKIDLLGLFRPIYREFHVPCTNSGGWADLNSRAQILSRFKYWHDRGKHCVLLPFGDFDIGGLKISSTVRSNLYEVADVAEWIPSADSLTIERFGLNFDTIEDMELLWIDGLVTGSGKDLGDPNHAQFHNSDVQDYIHRYGKRKVEANALLARLPEARQLCRDAILKYVPADAVENYDERLARVRGKLRRAIRKELGE